MKTIAIYCGKGGVGKTTIAVQLAYGLARLDHRVLLIDLNPNASATEWLADQLADSEREELFDRHIGHLLVSLDSASVESIRIPVSIYGHDLSLIPSSQSFVGFESQWMSRANGQFALMSQLRRSVTQYDYAIIDTAASEAHARTSLIAADYLVMPCDFRHLTIRTMDRSKDLIQDVDDLRQIGSREKLQILGLLPIRIPKASPNSRMERRFIEEVAAESEWPALKTILHERPIYHRFDAPIQHQESLSSVSAIEIGKLTSEVLELVNCSGG